VLLNDDDRTLIKTYTRSKMWFTDDADEIFGERLEKGRTGHLDLG